MEKALKIEEYREIREKNERASQNLEGRPKIDDYYDKICFGKQEKPFHEIILQLGDKDNMGATTENGQLAAKVLDEYMRDFQRRNPTLRVFSAYLHMDEATPHLHIDFVPYTTGSKRGLDTRVSLKQALSALGFKGGTRSETELNQWVQHEKKQLAEIMLERGIEWEQKGTHEKHLSVLDFKKKERAKEVAELEAKKESLEEHNVAILETSEKWLGELENLEQEIHSAQEIREEADKKAEVAKKEAARYSTFKIISALLGLQKGVIVDESSTMGYDGMDYGNAEWNGDLTLEEAFQNSCIWYFREVIDLVGRDKMQEELKNLQYGNCDISEWNGSNINPLEKLNGFWLDSSLKISPLEQVEVLSRIFEGHSDYDSRNIEILKRIMLVDENDSQKIYGKTGSGNGEAWFVGFSESSGERRYIAIYLNDSEHRDQVSGNKAKEIALDILQDWF